MRILLTQLRWYANGLYRWQQTARSFFWGTVRALMERGRRTRVDQTVTRVETDIGQFEANVLPKFLALYAPAPAAASEPGPVASVVRGGWAWAWAWAWVVWITPKNPGTEPSAAPPAAPVPAWCNEGIDPLIYDRPQLKEIMTDGNNALERGWARRRLLIHTPRGNIMMYYDIYKDGFVYYCDQSAVPYRILNAVAMKYVMMFRCVDFFMDEVVVPGNPSPILKQLTEEERSEVQRKTQVTRQLLGMDRKDNPFAKKPAMQPVLAASSLTSGAPILKNSVSVPEPSATPAKNPTTVLRRNRFIHMGKMRNIDMLQRPPKASSVIFKSEQGSEYAHLFSNKGGAGAESEIKSYKMYKNSICT